MRNGLAYYGISAGKEYPKPQLVQAVDEKGPGTVLEDFEVLLSFIGREGVPISGKFALLPMKLLPQLNHQLAHTIKIGLKHPQQNQAWWCYVLSVRFWG